MLLRNLSYFLGLIGSIDLKRVLYQLLMQLLSYAHWVFYSLYLIRFVVNSLETDPQWTQIISFIVITLIVTGLAKLYMSWFGHRYRPQSELRIQMNLLERVQEKISTLDISCYEDSQFYNRYTLAQKEISTRAESFLENSTKTIASLFGAVFVTYKLAEINPVMPFFMVLPLIGNLLFAQLLSKVYYKYDCESEESNKKQNYVSRLIYLPEYAKEIRLSNISKILTNHLHSAFQLRNRVIHKYSKKTSFWDSMVDLFTFTMPFHGAYLYGVYLALVRKTITMGDFAVVVTTIVSGSWILISFFDALKNLQKDLVYVKNYRQFTEYKKEILSPELPSEIPLPLETLDLSSLTLRYPGSDSLALKGVNLQVQAGEKIALVGFNGAGKTSLMKLILRFYDPQEGEIRWNGESIGNFDLDQYRGNFAAVFQDFQIYSMSIAENILMRPLDGQEDLTRVEVALKKVGLWEKISTLPKGVHTTLTREHDEEGTVFSGGEMQKVAIARVFVKDFDVGLFDEPSSALDPLSEEMIYRNILDHFKDKTLIFISHRLSVSKLVDRVCFLKEGAIVEQGSFTELEGQNGEFAEMYRLQMENQSNSPLLAKRGASC